MYINGMGSLSSQDNEGIFKGSVMEYRENIFPALDLKYRDYISPMALRRMSKAVKMGLTVSRRALQESGNSVPDAIITGTGQGCKQDTEKFLEEMLEQDENLLSPTSFIQSTHNTVGGQIALHLKCNSYNVTYSQNSGSLESALIDSHLLFDEQNAPLNILVGGVDEISSEITSFLYLDDQLKKEEIININLFETETPGTITSEGAHFFTISSEKKAETYCRIIDVSLFHAQSPNDVNDNIQQILNSNDLGVDDFDLVILGNNGDSRFDHYYKELQNDLFKEIPQLCYKHLVGDYNTVSGYSIWLGSKIIKTGNIPDIFKENRLESSSPQTILLYNHYLGENHSIILLGAP